MSRDDKVREEIEVGLVIILIILILCAAAAFGQDKLVPKLPLPPDLSHVDRPSCTVVEHGIADVLNAKTGQTEEKTSFRVEPFATYDDERKRWELPEETMTGSNTKHPGSIGEFASSHEAVDACFDWIKTVRAAKAKEVASLGHSTKK